MLNSREFEVQRVQFQIDLLIKTGIPLLAALEEVAVAEFILMAWIHDTAQKMSTLVVELLEAETDVQEQCISFFCITLFRYFICGYRDGGHARIPQVVTFE